MTFQQIDICHKKNTDLYQLLYDFYSDLTIRDSNITCGFCYNADDTVERAEHIEFLRQEFLKNKKSQYFVLVDWDLISFKLSFPLQINKEQFWKPKINKKYLKS